MSGKTTGNGNSAKAILVAGLAALAGFAAVYVTLGRPDNARPVVPTTTQASAPSQGAGKLNTGEMAAFVFKKEPEALTAFEFADAKGQQRTLADWKGRYVLLNLWATWCAPCRKEMPGLARLQKEMGSDKFEVLALAVDRAGAEAAQRFLTSIGATDLALYIDPTARAGTALRAAGMPTTLLLDTHGREIGRLTGAAEWDTQEAKALIRALMK